MPQSKGAVQRQTTGNVEDYQVNHVKYGDNNYLFLC